MPKNPKITVIMSVFNEEKYLKESIESILNQTNPHFELIIIDDASTDESLKIIKSYNDERIRIIENKKNLGLTKSLNKALKKAQGEYIARQDADDISNPKRLEEQLQHLTSHPETGLLGTSIYEINEKGKIIEKIVALSTPTLIDLYRANRFYHGSVMLKKQVIDDMDGYNELFKLSQDYELWLRIAKKYEIKNLKQALYGLRIHNENIRLKNIEESTLYSFLAIKLAKNEIDKHVLNTIKKKGIASLYDYLNKREKTKVQKIIHKATANMYLRNNDFDLAREEYKKIFKLDPFDFLNDINIIRSYLGENIMNKTSRIYGAYRNLIFHLKNYSSK